MAFTFGEQGNIGNNFREQGNIVKIILGNIGNYFRGTREHWALLSGNKGTWTPPGRPSLIPIFTALWLMDINLFAEATSLKLAYTFV